MPRNSPPPEVCPICGEDVPRNAKACPECGADDQTGWKDDAYSDGAVDLPDDEFDYNKFVDEEFGGSPKPSGLSPFWWVVAIVVTIAMFWVLVL